MLLTNLKKTALSTASAGAAARRQELQDGNSGNGAKFSARLQLAGARSATPAAGQLLARRFPEPHHHFSSSASLIKVRAANMLSCYYF